jgi:hypothetical protein
MLALDVEDEALAGVVAFYAMVHLTPEDLSTPALGPRSRMGRIRSAD